MATSSNEVDLDFYQPKMAAAIVTIIPHFTCDNSVAANKGTDWNTASIFENCQLLPLHLVEKKSQDTVVWAL